MTALAPEGIPPLPLVLSRSHGKTYTYLLKAFISLGVDVCISFSPTNLKWFLKIRKTPTRHNDACNCCASEYLIVSHCFPVQNHTLTQTEANNLDRNAVATGVASFLEDALNGKSANKHLRRANMLVMGKQVCAMRLYRQLHRARSFVVCPPSSNRERSFAGRVVAQGAPSTASK